MPRKKIRIILFLLVSFFFVIFLALLFYKNDYQKIYVLGGYAVPGEKWQRQFSSDYTESAEYISGESKHSPMRGPRNAHIKHQAHNAQGEAIFDVDYFYDNFGRRVVEQSENFTKKNLNKKFALFFGCTDLLGTGIDSIDTIPALFSKKIPEYTSYNYGFPLSAAQSVNRLAETIDYKAEVAEKSGLFIYVLSSGHYPRSFERVLPAVLTEMPRYEFEKKNLAYFNANENIPLPTFLSELEQSKLKYLGTLNEISPLLSWFKMYFSLSNMGALFGPDNFDNYTYNEHRLVCALIKTAQLNFLRQFPDSRFIILLHQILPLYERNHLVRCAKAANIEYIDAFTPSSADSFMAPPLYIYPLPLVNNMVVDKLVEHLKTTPNN